jgi:hypothetical protein
MNAGTSSTGRLGLPETEADIDQFMVEHHEEVATKLAAAQGEIARGEALALEPLEELVRDARTAG